MVIFIQSFENEVCIVCRIYNNVKEHGNNVQQFLDIARAKCGNMRIILCLNEEPLVLRANELISMTLFLTHGKLTE